MKRKFASISLLVLVLISMAMMAQSAPAAAPATTPSTNPLSTATGTKVAAIDMQGAIFGNNEGQRDIEALAKKFEPKRTELQRLNTEIEDLKKQLNTQGDKMSPEAHDNLVKSIETKQKSLQRSAEDAQTEFQQQQNEIAQRIMQKLVPVMTKYLADNGYGLVFDASSPWPQGPVVVATPAMDITKAVVDAYNAQSGVPTPAKSPAATTPHPAGASPAAAKPATTAPAASKPATTTTSKPN